MTPDVSIILPIYNVERFLEQCLQSVVGQSLDNIEVICVNDGSTDGSGKIIDRFASADARIVAIHKENGGYGKAVNTGIKLACGDYIGIVEPDDYVDPSMFEKLVCEARQFNNPDVVKSAYWRVIDQNDGEQITPCFYFNGVAHTDTVFSLDEDAEFLYHHPSIWTAIYRRSFLNEKGILMHEIPGAGWADNPWLMETLVQAESIVYLDECLYYYREFNQGSSSNVKDPSIIYDRWFDMDEIIKRLGVTSPQILEGHYNRGCAYIEMLQLEFDASDPIVRQALRQMVARIDYRSVRKSKKIPRPYKDAFYKQKSPLLYLMHRIGRKVRSLAS